MSVCQFLISHRIINPAEPSADVYLSLKHPHVHTCSPWVNLSRKLASHSLVALLACLVFFVPEGAGLSIAGTWLSLSCAKCGA